MSMVGCYMGIHILYHHGWDTAHYYICGDETGVLPLDYRGSQVISARLVVWNTEATVATHSDRITAIYTHISFINNYFWFYRYIIFDCRWCVSETLFLNSTMYPYTCMPKI